jgi:hypothetical protein
VARAHVSESSWRGHEPAFAVNISARRSLRDRARAALPQYGGIVHLAASPALSPRRRKRPSSARRRSTLREERCAVDADCSNRVMRSNVEL